MIIWFFQFYKKIENFLNEEIWENLINFWYTKDNILF